jgi:hypothetical protein
LRELLAATYYRIQRFFLAVGFYLSPTNNWRRAKWCLAIAGRSLFSFALKGVRKGEVERLEGELRKAVQGEQRLKHRAQVHYGHLLNEHLALKKDFEDVQAKLQNLERYQMGHATKQVNKLVEMGKLLGHEHHRDRESGDGKKLIELKEQTMQLVSEMEASHTALWISHLMTQGMTNEEAREFARKYAADEETIQWLQSPSQDPRLDPLLKAPDIFAAPTIKAMELMGIPLEQQRELAAEPSPEE